MSVILRQYIEMLWGLKTQTRRLNKPTYKTGDTRAAVPKRGHPAWWYVPGEPPIRVQKPRVYVANVLGYGMATISAAEAKRHLQKQGAVQVRIKILGIRQEPLQDIGLRDALDEGVADVEEYRVLWDKINPKHPWETNPMVWVINFRVDRQAQLLERALIKHGSWVNE